MVPQGAHCGGQGHIPGVVIPVVVVPEEVISEVSPDEVVPLMVIPGLLGDYLIGRLYRGRLSRGRLSQASWICNVVLNACKLLCVQPGRVGGVVDKLRGLMRVECHHERRQSRTGKLDPRGWDVH